MIRLQKQRQLHKEELSSLQRLPRPHHPVQFKPVNPQGVFLQRLRPRVVPLDAAIVGNKAAMLDALQKGHPVPFVTFRFSIALDLNDTVFCPLRLVTQYTREDVSEEPANQNTRFNGPKYSNPHSVFPSQPPHCLGPTKPPIEGYCGKRAGSQLVSIWCRG